VVALAKEIVPDYTAAPTAPEGEVLNMNLDAAVDILVPGDAVLSRLNAPLMGIALSLIRKGTPARIEGRDIGKQLVKRVQKLKAKSVPDFLKKAANWASKQTTRINAAGGKYVKSKVETVQDELLTLQTVAEGCASVAEIEARIISLFEDSDKTVKPAVVLSSVHKAKGLEWNRVCLIASTFKNKSAEGEEANIYYVAVTRAKKTLIFGA
jgi:superfamily I DNA/RNA helicase